MLLAPLYTSIKSLYYHLCYFYFLKPNVLDIMYIDINFIKCMYNVKYCIITADPNSKYGVFKAISEPSSSSTLASTEAATSLGKLQ